MKLIKYLCLGLTILFAVALVLNIYLGRTDTLITGIILLTLSSFLAFRADKAVKNNKSH